MCEVQIWLPAEESLHSRDDLKQVKSEMNQQYLMKDGLILMWMTDWTATTVLRFPAMGYVAKKHIRNKNTMSQSHKR